MTVVIVTLVTIAGVTVVILTSFSKNNLTPRQLMRCFWGSFLRFLQCFFYLWRNSSAKQYFKNTIIFPSSSIIIFFFKLFFCSCLLIILLFISQAFFFFPFVVSWFLSSQFALCFDSLFLSYRIFFFFFLLFFGVVVVTHLPPRCTRERQEWGSRAVYS